MPETADREVVVEFDSVALRFEDKIVFRDISFQLERGETKMILGVTGTGKSVLLKLTMGLLKPDSGSIFVMGEDITKLDEQELFPIRRKIGMVFQESALFDSFTVRENVGYVLERLMHEDPEEAERRVQEALRFVELEQTIDLMPSELSGGMKRRVGIARAVIGQPQIMLFDSPTGGLDPITATHIMALLVKQRDVRQVSSLLVTHRVQDAVMMANSCFNPETGTLSPVKLTGDTHTRFLMLREGDIIFHGTLGELSSHSDPYIRKFLV